VGNRRAKIDADNSAFSVLSGTTLPRVQRYNRRDRFREDRLSELMVGWKVCTLAAILAYRDRQSPSV
jgi:hypothetical protein